MKLSKLTDLFVKYKEIIMYLIFGVCTTAVNFIVYTFFVELLNLDITISNAIAWVFAVSFAFVTNKIIVFHSHQNSFFGLIKEILSFFGSRIISGFVEIFLPTLLFNIGLDGEIFGVKGLVAKVLVSVIVIILNYVFSKVFVFKKVRGNGGNEQ